jgi:DNA-binding transcriptional LysR family regulator
MPNPSEHNSRVNLRQLRYFLALCEERNFTRAARRCQVSQPSLTNAIKALEKELGGPLFHRKPGIRPTELGEALLPRFKSIISALDDTSRIVAALSCRLAPAPGRDRQLSAEGRTTSDRLINLAGTP